MSAEALVMAALFSSHLDVQDLFYDGEVVWAASSGGVLAYDTDGELLAEVSDLPTRQAMSLGELNGALTVGTAAGAYRWSGEEWKSVGLQKPVVAVTENVLVYRDGSAWPMAMDGPPVVEAVAYNGQMVRVTGDGRLLMGEQEWTLPGPPADMALVDGEIRIACHIGAAIFDGETLRTLQIPATAAGEIWGTSEGALVDDSGQRIGGLSGSIRSIEKVGKQWVVGSEEGVWSLGESLKTWSTAGICGNFITGLTRHQGDLIVGTFNDGACRLKDGQWSLVETPSTMVNDVLSVDNELWLATAEGLVKHGEEIFVEVADNQRRSDPGTNHRGINALSASKGQLWAADVLGPVQVEPWRRYRWHVAGHSYQSIAACEDGSVWAGSEDDGVAIYGAEVGQKKGRSKWRQFNRFDGLPEDWVMSLACAGEGAAYVGTYRNGVGRVDSAGWTPILEDAWVQALTVDGDRLWIGTADGLYLYQDGGMNKLRDDDVHTLLLEGSRLWVGTRSGLLEFETSGLAAGLARTASRSQE